MTTYPATDRTPFTYYIKWSKHNIAYYGCRWSRGCLPTDLWKNYFTSSKYVREFIKLHGDPDIIKITRIFDTAEKCISWESKFLCKVNASKNHRFLNRANANSYGKSIFKPLTLPSNTTVHGYTEHLIKQTCGILDIPYNNGKPSRKGMCWVQYVLGPTSSIKISLPTQIERDEFLLSNSSWISGKMSEEQKINNSTQLTGVKKPPRSESHCKNISIATKGKSSIGSGHNGSIWIHNNITEIFVDKNSDLPYGWVRGRIPGKYGRLFNQ